MGKNKLSNAPRCAPPANQAQPGESGRKPWNKLCKPECRPRARKAPAAKTDARALCAASSSTQPASCAREPTFAAFSTAARAAPAAPFSITPQTSSTYCVTVSTRKRLERHSMSTGKLRLIGRSDVEALLAAPPKPASRNLEPVQHNQRSDRGGNLGVEIRSSNLRLTEALKNYVQHRFGVALRRIDGRVRNLTVRLGDKNGPRGGADKLCRIDAELHPLGHVTLEECDRDAYAAIDRASGRLRRAVIRSIQHARQRRRGRQSVRLPGPSLARSLGAFNLQP